MAYLHYCDIFSECYHCPLAFCPYEKLDDESYSGWSDENEDEDQEEDQEETW